MKLPPRPPNIPLLDRLSLSFIFETGTLKAAIGLFILGYMHWRGAPPLDTITAVFLYESISQLLFVYPAKDLKARSPTNVGLIVTVWASIALQLATVMIPGTRTMLGLTTLNRETWLLVLITVAITHSGAMVLSWLLRLRADRDRFNRDATGA